ncbi:MAG: transcription elongation factor GreA [Lachnospiraceae bacterium]|nr:transcription elongation factor GreA [Lachnospiraceae bacterium]
MHDRLTKGDIKKMQDEIWYRRTELRPRLLKSLQEARAQGDLSENFEYYAAKREKNINESRIRYLENMIKTATVIEDDSAPDEVGLNNTVTVLFVEDDEEETVRIVTTVRSDVTENMVSIDSPLGKALMKLHAGDTAEVVTETGYRYHVTVKNIVKTTDEENDRISTY